MAKLNGTPKKIFVTTVRIAVVAENEMEASDVISMGLSENLQENGAILDWGYEKIPIPFVDKGEYKPDEYTEGDAIVDVNPDYMKEIKNNLREGRKLQAIKIYKDATGKHLKQSKEFIDTLCPEYYKPFELKRIL
jgi:hypothetical protein